MNRDFEMLSALIEARASFLIVGAHALAAHLDLLEEADRGGSAE